MVVYVIPCSAFALNILDHVISWYMTMVLHGCLCCSMFCPAFCLEHGWSFYIMVSFSPDQPWKIIVCCSLTISILDHNWPWLKAVIVSIVFTWLTMSQHWQFGPWWTDGSKLYIRAGSRRSSAASKVLPATFITSRVKIWQGDDRVLNFAFFAIAKKIAKIKTR